MVSQMILSEETNSVVTKRPASERNWNPENALIFFPGGRGEMWSGGQPPNFKSQK